MKDTSYNIQQQQTITTSSDQARVGAVVLPSCSQSGRDNKGRFSSGNRAALGHGNRARNNLFCFREAISEDDIAEIASLLLEKARQGNLNAIKILLGYCLPAQAALFRVDEKRERQEENFLKYGDSFY